MTPTLLAGSETKFHFLPVTPPVTLIKPARGLPSFATHKHAKSDRGRQCHRHTRVRDTHGVIQAGNPDIVLGFSSVTAPGIAGDGGVVRERRDGRNPSLRRGMRHHSIKPVAMNLRVGV